LGFYNYRGEVTSNTPINIDHGDVTSARNERHTVLPEILKKERRKGDGGWS
jgi:hypothetical protein